MIEQTDRFELGKRKVLAWIEDDSTIMLQANSSTGDPAKLTSAEAEVVARHLMNFVWKLTNGPSVSITLSRDEALVLFECVSRFSQTDELGIEDPAEKQALWSVCNELEQALVEPLLPDYRDRLEGARERLCKDLE